jgi:UDP-N-acetylenolpyruvoylglucosamine reductase
MIDEHMSIQLENQFPGRIKRDEPMSSHTTFKIGGPADLFFEARTTDELVRVVIAARELSIPITIVGGGSNILVGDRGIRGLVVKNSATKISTRAMKGEIVGGEPKEYVFLEVDSGVPFNRLVRYTADGGLAGIEMHLGLPGTVGGAVYQNSKWMKPPSFVGDAVYQAKILTPDNEVKTVPASYFQFGYDTSTIQKTKDIVLAVIFVFKKDQSERLWSIANASIAHRRETQPQGALTAGCMFKNISKEQSIAKNLPDFTTSAGFLLDHAGMKGAKVGDAKISQTHANFVENCGNARACDVVQLIDRAKEQVKKRFGIELTEEVERI